MKPRQHVYFDKALAERLDAHASKTGASKSSVVTAAVRAYLDRRGAKELDDLLGVRLRRLERDQQVILESLALFIRYQFTITAPMQPPLPWGRTAFRRSSIRWGGASPAAA